MTATDRTRRQSITDQEGRPARIEAVTRDLRADVEFYTEEERERR